MKRKDQISGGFWFFISLVVIQQSLGMGLGTIRSAGAGLIPFICGITLAILSVMTIINGFVQKTGAGEILSEGVPWKVWGWLMIVVGGLLGFALAFSYLGFFFSSFCILVLLFRGFRKWWGSFLAAGLTVSLSYLLFHVLLKMQFPRGPWVN